MSRDEVSITNPKQADDTRTFTYDAVFGQAATQKSIYTKSAFPLVESVLDGYTATDQIQRHHLRLWTDWLRQDLHHDGRDFQRNAQSTRC